MNEADPREALNRPLTAAEQAAFDAWDRYRAVIVGVQNGTRAAPELASARVGFMVAMQRLDEPGSAT